MTPFGVKEGDPVQQRSRVFFSVLIASILVAGGVLALAFQAFLNPPDFSQMKTQIEVRIKLANGQDSTRKVGPQTADWVPISQVSNKLLFAIISSEDTSFYSHSGIDVHEVKESLKKDLKEKKWARGGSTITQQVIKNTFLTPEKTLWRKVKEVVYAFQLEREFKKNQILEFYVNLVEWGPGMYGIRQAANVYFGKSPSELTAKEGAFLALLLPSPRKYFVYFKNKELTQWAGNRLDKIVMIMNSMGFLTEEEYQSAQSESLWGKSDYVSDTPGAEEVIPSDEGAPPLLEPVEETEIEE